MSSYTKEEQYTILGYSIESVEECLELLEMCEPDSIIYDVIDKLEWTLKYLKEIEVG